MYKNSIVIDVKTHPYLFTEICQTQEDCDFAIQTTGLLHSGPYAANNSFSKMNVANIDKAVLSPLDLTTAKGRWMATNEQTAEMVEKYPDRFFAFASVDPNREDAADVLEKAFSDLKLKGLHLFPALQQFSPDDEKMEKIYDICEHYDVPVLFDAGCSPYPRLSTKYAHPLLLEDVALNRKNLRICISRFAWPWVREVCMLMLKCHNVYTDTSFVYLDNPKEMYRQTFTSEMGPKWIERGFRHQVMFGSGSPGLEQIRMAEAIYNMDWREGTIENVMGKNALEFMGIEKDMRWLND